MSAFEGAKIYYFNGRGVAETARVMMKVSNFTYEDVRYPITVNPAGGYLREEFEKDQNNATFPLKHSLRTSREMVLH